jgi:hypothetical protein
MHLKVAGGPTMNMLGEGKIESALEEGAELALLGEDGRSAILTIADPGSSISVKDKDGRVRYEGWGSGRKLSVSVAGFQLDRQSK